MSKGMLNIDSIMLFVVFVLCNVTFHIYTINECFYKYTFIEYGL